MSWDKLLQRIQPTLEGIFAPVLNLEQDFGASLGLDAEDVLAFGVVVSDLHVRL